MDNQKDDEISPELIAFYEKMMKKKRESLKNIEQKIGEHFNMQNTKKINDEDNQEVNQLKEKGKIQSQEEQQQIIKETKEQQPIDIKHKEMDQKEEKQLEQDYSQKKLVEDETIQKLFSELSVTDQQNKVNSDSSKCSQTGVQFLRERQREQLRKSELESQFQIKRSKGRKSRSKSKKKSY